MAGLSCEEAGWKAAAGASGHRMVGREGGAGPISE